METKEFVGVLQTVRCHIVQLNRFLHKWSHALVSHGALFPATSSDQLEDPALLRAFGDLVGNLLAGSQANMRAVCFEVSCERVSESPNGKTERLNVQLLNRFMQISCICWAKVDGFSHISSISIP